MIPLPWFAKRICLVARHPATWLALCVHREKQFIYFLPSDFWFWPFFFFFLFPSENYWSKEPKQGNIPMQGPLTTTSIYKAENISKHFAVCMWNLVPTLERCTERDLLQKEKSKCCFCFAPFPIATRVMSGRSSSTAPHPHCVYAALVHLNVDANDFSRVMLWLRGKARK